MISLDLSDYSTYIWVYGFFLFLAIHSLITLANKQYIAIYMMAIGLLVFGMYQRHIKEVTGTSSREKHVTQLIDTTQKGDVVKGTLNKKYSLAHALIKSDTLLWNTLQKCEKYKDIDRQVYDNIITFTVKFYDLYGKILKGRKDVHVHMNGLMETRRMLMNSIQPLFFQMDIANYSDLKKISLHLMSSTHRCLNVLKNKFNIDKHVNPIARNSVGDVYDMF